LTKAHLKHTVPEAIKYDVVRVASVLLILYVPYIPDLSKTFIMKVIPVSLLGSSLLASFSGAVSCSLVTICFTSSIQLWDVNIM
ncbi:hypothetical protein STEG23_022993, partial [Scotinomys teguina]